MAEKQSTPHWDHESKYGKEIPHVKPQKGGSGQSGQQSNSSQGATKK